MKSQNQLLHDLAFLAGTQAAGRLSGTPGAYKSAVYLSAELKAAGLQPVDGNNYFQTVNVPAPRLFGTPKLVIGEKTCIHRKDFSEIPTLAAGGYYSGRLLVVREDDQLLQEDFARRIVLIPQRPEGFDWNATVNTAMDMGVTALLVESDMPDWFKTVYPRNMRLPVIRLRKSLAQEMASMNGATVELDLPLANETLPCQNVLGLLRGASEDFTLALTAHYDHVGDDPSGVRFPGALDNASGVATILAVLRELTSKPLPFNVLVAFLTGEESGFWGAKHLLANQPLPISAVINLDVIGSEPALSTVRVSHSKRNDWLAVMAGNILEEHGVTVQWVKITDDSSVFINAGIPTVGLGQQRTRQGGSGMPIPSDTYDKLHIPSDTYDNLHIETILSGVQVILDVIQTLAKSEIQTKEKIHV
jgi:Iap family predicted aminopeptidase